MDMTALIPGIVGAIIGSVGWLFVGLYIQRTQFRRAARNATRAVYIELEMNRLNIAMARDFGSHLALSRSAFERLLPELATWLTASQLRLVAAAYMSHAGYEQVRNAPDLPAEMRKQALSGILDAHDAALHLIAGLVFTRAERRSAAPAELQSTDISGGTGG